VARTKIGVGSYVRVRIRGKLLYGIVLGIDREKKEAIIDIEPTSLDTEGKDGIERVPLEAVESVFEVGVGA
jgi:hypothetical protein